LCLKQISISSRSALIYNIYIEREREGERERAHYIYIEREHILYSLYKVAVA